MQVRPFAMVIATIYSLAGIAALVVGFALPADGPLAAVYAVILGVPWVQLLGRLDLFAEAPASVNIALVSAAIALNAGLLWLWALTRQSG